MVTDDFLRSLLERPELAPGRPNRAPANSRCTSACSRDPRAEVDAQELAALHRRGRAGQLRRSGCAFASGCWRTPTLEASYVALFRGEGVDVPPLFVHQLTQILLRHILGERGTADAGARRRNAVSPPAHRDAGGRAGDGRRRRNRRAACDGGQLRRHRRVAASRAARRCARPNSTCCATTNADVYWERDESHDLVGQPEPRPAGAGRRCAACSKRWVGISWNARCASQVERARSTTTTGSGMSAWMRRPARSSTTCTRATT